MGSERKTLLGKVAGIAAVVPLLVWAYKTGPDPGHTGAPGESTCNQASCHVGTALNGGGGKVEIVFPDGQTGYTPGTRLRMQVKVTDAAARAYGFQMTAKLSSGGPAGTFSPTSATTFVVCANGNDRPAGGSCGTGLEYIEHNQPSSSNTLSFDWTPPSTASGTVSFYVAANAANGNGNESGDHIYTTSLQLPVAAAAGPKPAISQGGVVDAINFQAGVASNTYIGIFGSNLSTTTRTWDGAIVNGVLPTTLDGVSVTVNGKPAAVYAVTPTQINVLAPDDAATGSVSVVVTNANGASDPMVVNKTAYLPAFYAPFANGGKLYATVVQATTGEILGTPGVEPRAVRPVRPGEVVLVYGTGFGQTNPASPTDQVVAPRQLAVKPTLRLGQSVASFIDNGYQIGPGWVQFNMTVPDLPDGEYAFIAEIGGATSSNKVYLTVKR